MKIYIACALTHVPRGEAFEQHTSFIHSVASAMKALGHDVKYALVNSDPQLAEKPLEDRARLCYLWDRSMVEESDLVIAEASFPSTGLGIEIQIAENTATPIIYCYRKVDANRVKPVQYETPDHLQHTLQVGEGYITLMALGVPSIFRVIAYSTNEDGIKQLCEAVSLLQQD